MATRVRSFAKINLGLAVGPPRLDGFHELATAYQTVALHEFVTVSARRASGTTLRVTANHAGVPCSKTGTAERNTTWKMVALALERLGVTAEVHIDIVKRLPVQGGLGAGSANAAAALLGLERELGIALRGAERLELAQAVGSDVPIFLLGGTVLGLSRGEEVYPLPESPPLACVIAVPRVGVSTAQAFRELDARGPAFGPAETATSGDEPLTSPHPADRLKELSRALAAVWTMNGAEPGPSGITPTIFPDSSSGSPLKDETSEQPRLPRDVESDLAENPLLALVRTGIENDFEEVVFSQHPFLRSTKRELMGNSGSSGESGGALYAALSGSGSALFGLYRSQADARAAQQRVRRSGTRAILTETLPRREYWRTMFAG